MVNGFTTVQDDGEVVVSPMPLDETVVEVLLWDGRVVLAWYSRDIQEPGDWDFLPLGEDGRPDTGADSITDQVEAWRPVPN